MLSEQHRRCLEWIALLGLPLLPAMYQVRLIWDSKTNGMDFLPLLVESLTAYSIWLGTELALLGRVPGFRPGMARGWAIAFYGLPLLPALYYVRPKLDTTTNGQDFFGVLGWFFFYYFGWLGVEYALLWSISRLTETGMIFSAHDEAQQYSDDEQQIIVPHSDQPPRGGWSEWRRR